MSLEESSISFSDIIHKIITLLQALRALMEFLNCSAISLYVVSTVTQTSHSYKS